MNVNKTLRGQPVCLKMYEKPEMGSRQRSIWGADRGRYGEQTEVDISCTDSSGVIIWPQCMFLWLRRPTPHRRTRGEQQRQLTRRAHTECTRGSVRYTSICFVIDGLWCPSKISPAYVLRSRFWPKNGVLSNSGNRFL